MNVRTTAQIVIEMPSVQIQMVLLNVIVNKDLMEMDTIAHVQPHVCM